MAENTELLQNPRQDTSSEYRALTKQEIEELQKDKRESLEYMKKAFAHLKRIV